jgi:hypothetical protein
MLDRPYGQVSAGDLILYVWPSAATHPVWEFGSYIGYRVGVTETGDWL